MDFKKLVWNKYPHSDLETTLFTPMNCWVMCIIFEKDGKWHLHYESKDPSEHIFTGDTLAEVKQHAQQYHEMSVKKAFFKGE